MKITGLLKSISKYAVFVYGLFMLVQNYIIDYFPSEDDKIEETTDSTSTVVIQDTSKIDTIVQ